jgi:hypothetical protein
VRQNNSHKVVLVTALLVFGLGWFNSAKEGKTPSAHFLIGAGVTFTLLSFLSDYSPEAANALSLAIATTALFSKEGGNVLGYINKEGELDTSEESTAGSTAGRSAGKSAKVTKVHTDSVGQIPGMG